MQLLLPTGSMKLIDSFVRFSTNKFRMLFFSWMLFLGFMINANAQTQPEYIQNWTPLEEAEFQFDVFYAVVKCHPFSDPMIFINAFNEAGNVDAIGFTLEFQDEAGNKATVEIEKFEIGKAEMYVPSCRNDDHSNLKFEVPDGLDPATLSIEITYNK